MNDPVQQEATDRCGRLINEPEGAKRFAAARMVYLAICDGDGAAAMLLNELEFLTGCERDYRQKTGRHLGEPIWVRMTKEDLRAALWGMVNEKDCLKTMKWLASIGFVVAEQRKAADRAWHYRFDADAIQAALDWWYAAYTHREVLPDVSAIGNSDPMQEEDLPDASTQNFPMERENIPDPTGQNFPMIPKSLKDSSGDGYLESSSAARVGAREDDDDENFDPTPELKIVPKTASAESASPALPVVVESPDVRDAHIFALYHRWIGEEPDAATRATLTVECAPYTVDEISDAFATLVGRDVSLSGRWRYVKKSLITRHEQLMQQAAAVAQRAADAQRIMAAITDRQRMPEAAPPPTFAGRDEDLWAWLAAFDQLRTQFDSQTVNTYLRDARLVRVDGETFVIAVRSEYAKAQCEGRLARNIQRLLRDAAGREVEVEFVIGEALREAALE